MAGSLADIEGLHPEELFLEGQINRPTRRSPWGARRKARRDEIPVKGRGWTGRSALIVLLRERPGGSRN